MAMAAWILRIMGRVRVRLPSKTSATLAREPMRGSSSFRDHPSCSMRALIASTGSGGGIGHCRRS